MSDQTTESTPFELAMFRLRYAFERFQAAMTASVEAERERSRQVAVSRKAAEQLAAERVEARYRAFKSARDAEVET